VNNIYLPQLAEIVGVEEETPDTRTYALKLVNGAPSPVFDYRPMQFIELTVFGVGEAPFGLCSSPTRAGSFSTTVRAVGSVTNALHQLGAGDQIGVRGPLGNGFDPQTVKGRNLLFIAGGIGLPPLRSLIWNVLDRRQDYGDVTILYGARTPTDLVYKPLLKEWEKRDDLKFLVTVDQGDETWQGRVGMVPTLFEPAQVTVEGTTAFVCGPPIMIRFVVLELERMGFGPDAIVTTLERHMKCGVGKCNHCAIGHHYVCMDGPVFNFQQIKQFMEEA
jgi:sulfhydrogenase subunit gamma (sulfur reductase)